MGSLLRVWSGLGALAWMAVSQGVPPASQSQPRIVRAGTAFILGRVVEAGTATPVPEAVVTLSAPELRGSADVFDDGTPGGVRRVVVDGNGRFLFRGLPAGRYRIAATAPGFVDGAYGETHPIQIRRTLDAALARGIDLEDGQRAVGADIQLWKQAGVSGLVTDEAGEPMVGVTVSVMSRVTDWGGTLTTQAATAQTDDRGRYHADVIPGTYVVAVRATPATLPASALDDYQEARAGGSAALREYDERRRAGNAPIPTSGGVRVGDWMLATGPRSVIATIAGGAIVYSGAALADRPAASPLAFTGVDGRLFVYPTTYYPAASSADGAAVVTLASGEERSGIDIRLEPRPTVRVAGVVEGPHGPEPGLGVMLIVPDQMTQRTSPAFLTDTAQSLTDRLGRFTFLGVVPGQYVLRVLRAPTRTDDSILWAAEKMAVGTEDVDVAVRLQAGVRVSGRVVIEGDGPALPAAALRALRIAPRPVTGSISSLVTTQQMVIGTGGMLDDRLQFTTPGIVPGPHVINVTGVPGGLVLKSVMARGTDAVDTPVEIGPGGLTDVVVTLTRRVSAVTGMVRGADGRPAPMAAVGVFPVSRALWRRAGMASRRVQATSPGRDGIYAFSGLPAGEYFIVATEGPHPDFSDPAVLTSLIPAATRVTLDDGGRLTVNLQAVDRGRRP